ncbi:transcription elongation factor, mitochondrial [Brienomyrus brachyistius]|uniref:transcription elongation factor, mitochondrial n=1 Tax=Brienomyrus brachyistius TaxID=42636 RepID=UPI0020B31EA6|nr:transcription elongation factor, mitochondrial [Brienomyrus brachyistius]
MWVIRYLLSAAVQRGHPGFLRRPLGSLPERYHRYLHCTCCWSSRISIADIDSTICKDDPKSLDDCYTPEQRAAILQLLNSASEDELAGVKLLRGQKAINIVEYRNRNGPFRDLESIVNVPLLKHKTATVVFNSIICPQEKKDKRKPKVQIARFIKPEVDRSILKEANSIVSIICGTNKIAWAHVDCALSVLNWQQEDCPNFMRGTYMAAAYLEDVTTVVSRMPAADLFVVEKPGISLQNTSLYSVMAHLRTVEAMLFALLGAPREPGATPKVVNMMRVAVGRHFGLMVGEARTSGARTVRDMMTDSATRKAPHVTFPHELLVRYRNAFKVGTRNHGEELCDALLQAVAFYELLSE